MGCCNKSEGVLEDPLSKEVIEYIRSNLEGNLVKQSTLNAELNNTYKKFEENPESTPEEVIKDYRDLLIKLTNTKPEQEKECNDIRELLTNAMKVVKNDIPSFHNLILEKLKGIRDYSNLKLTLDKNPSLKEKIVKNHHLFVKIFEELKKQGITKISQCDFEKFKDLCIKNGVDMTEDELKQYYEMLKCGHKKKVDISKIKELLDQKENENLKNSIVRSKNNFNTLIIKLDASGCSESKGTYVAYMSRMSFEDFKKLCEESGIELEESELREVYGLIKNDYVAFINYIKHFFDPDDEEDDLLKKANLIYNLCKIDLQALPVAPKLERFF